MKHLPLIIVALTLASCTKDLELDYRDLDSIPVIEANLTGKGLSVRLTLTSPMDEPMDTVAQTDYIASLTELPDDNYRLDIDFRGQHFYSECQMQSDSEILDVKFQWTKMPYDHVAVMTLFLRDNPASPTKLGGYAYGATARYINGCVLTTSMPSTVWSRPL